MDQSQRWRTAVLGAAAVSGVLATAQAETVQVEVKQAKLTQEPRSLSKVVAEVKLGDKVDVQKKEKGWWQVKPADQPAGWITKNALASTKTSLKAGEAGDTGVSQDEQALAYRPFSPEVEKVYRDDNPSLATGYAALEKIERDPAYTVKDEQVTQFLKDGQVGGGVK